MQCNVMYPASRTSQGPRAQRARHAPDEPRRAALLARHRRGADDGPRVVPGPRARRRTCVADRPPPEDTKRTPRRTTADARSAATGMFGHLRPELLTSARLNRAKFYDETQVLRDEVSAGCLFIVLCRRAHHEGSDCRPARPCQRPTPPPHVHRRAANARTATVRDMYRSPLPPFAPGGSTTGAQIAGELRAALAIDAGSAEAHFLLGQQLCREHAGALTDADAVALRHLRRAVALEPKWHASLAPREAAALAQLPN